MSTEQKKNIQHACVKLYRKYKATLLFEILLVDVDAVTRYFTAPCNTRARKRRRSEIARFSRNANDDSVLLMRNECTRLSNRAGSAMEISANRQHGRNCASSSLMTRQHPDISPAILYLFIPGGLSKSSYYVFSHVTLCCTAM